MKKIKKAVIPAAGLGTRFLPATKAMPKEMLPIVDKPTIQYIVEEAVESGIEDIMIVSGKGKRAIEDHFDFSLDLEQTLVMRDKQELLEKVQYASHLVNIHYIRQREPLGLGHAVWCARKFIGDEPFAVLLGDDIVEAETPGLKQLINEYNETGSPIIGVQQVEDHQTHRYGIIDPFEKVGRRYRFSNVIEKPKYDPPSNLAVMGRYILTPEIFKLLEKQQTGAGGEIQLTDAVQFLNKIQDIFAYHFQGKRFDVGEKLGFILTNIHFGLKDKDIGDNLLDELKKLLSEKTQKK